MSQTSHGQQSGAGAPTEELTLRHNAAAQQYEAVDGQRVLGVAAYRGQGGTRVFDHTETDPSLRGTGIAAKLVRYALEDTVKEGKKIVPVCSYVQAFVRKNPEFAEDVAAS